jgi:dTDP-4-amino-4,6-dideoxygalactose transaminase
MVQLGRLRTIVDRRRELAGNYQALLADVPGLRTADDPPWGTSNYQSFWVLLPDYVVVDRNDVLAQMASQGISGRRGIMAAHLEPAYRGVAHTPLPNTETLANRSLILPLFHELTGADQERVVTALRAAAGLG